MQYDRSQVSRRINDLKYLQTSHASGSLTCSNQLLLLSQN